MGKMFTCQICGKEFETNVRFKKYCGDECSTKAKHQKDRVRIYGEPRAAYERGKESKWAEAAARAESERNRKERAMIEAEARKLGMHYGTYTALMEMKKQNERKNGSVYCRGR